TNAGVVFNQGTQQAGNMFGGFVGYNVQRGHLVYGGELAAQFGKFAMTGFPNSVYTNFIDLKARVGYATDRVLVFGAIGGMVGHFDDGPAIDFTLAGLTLGAGVDVMVTDKVFIGGEVTHRIFRGDDATRPLIDWHANSTEVSLRAGVRF
ncbi:MAG: outer membrane beta-barrel protein, partial [Rhizobiaceae bacterium]